MKFILDKNEITNNCLLYFYTTWMPYQKKYNNVLSNYSDKYKIDIYAIDCDQFDFLKIKYEIKSVPTFLFLIDGKPKSVIEGIAMASAIKSKIIKHFGDLND